MRTQLSKCSNKRVGKITVNTILNANCCRFLTCVSQVSNLDVTYERGRGKHIS